MSEAKNLLRAKLLASVTEYCFEDSQSDPAFAKQAYNTIKNLFDVDTVPEQNSPSVALPSDTNKKSRHIPNALSAQIKNKINDMRDLVQEHRIEIKSGRKGKRVNWSDVADAAYNRFNIRTQEGAKPEPRQFADAYNHLRHYYYNGVVE